MEKKRTCNICGGDETVIEMNNVDICLQCLLNINRRIEQDSFKMPLLRKQLDDFYQKYPRTYVPKPVKPKTIKLEKPIVLKEYMDRFVIGQEKAKRALAVAVYNHYKRIQNSKIGKSNILISGPTGSGKTLLVRTLAEKINVPLVIVDATTLTKAGYVGSDVESMLTALYQEAGYDIERVQNGIIYIDEIDKLNSSEKIGEGVQQALLKMLEGSLVNVPVGGQKTNPMTVTIDTKNILFICGGSFASAEESARRTIGFQTDERQIDYGIIPELAGRLPVKIKLNPLTKEELIRVMQEPEHSIINEYKELLNMDNIELNFTDDALDCIAEKAIQLGTGARSIRSIIEEFMTDIMFELPSDRSATRCVITDKTVNGGEPVIFRCIPLEIKLRMEERKKWEQAKANKESF